MEIFYKNEKWLYKLTTFDYSKYITISEYDKATITYPVEKIIYQIKTETKIDKVVDADWKEVVLREYEVKTPIIDDNWNHIIKEKVREMVRYNKYDLDYIIIPDDTTIITKSEFDVLIENKKKLYETKK